MPKPTLTDEQINNRKQDIMNAAIELITTKGFSNFSMRKIAANTGMTAANIYNYFSGKDEIYLHIQIKGFEMLFDLINEAYNMKSDRLERLRNMMSTYIDFGVKQSDYYEIMLGSNTPKYSDYVGTELESLALEEKETALRLVQFTASVIIESTKGIEKSTFEQAKVATMHVWCVLHGLVSLLNIRVIQEVEDKPEMLIDNLINQLISNLSDSG